MCHRAKLTYTLCESSKSVHLCDMSWPHVVMVFYVVICRTTVVIYRTTMVLHWSSLVLHMFIAVFYWTSSRLEQLSVTGLSKIGNLLFGNIRLELNLPNYIIVW